MAGAVWLRISGVARKGNGMEKLVLSISLGLVSAILGGALSTIAGISADLVGNIILISALVALIGYWVIKKPSLAPSRREFNRLSRYWLPISLFSFHITLWAIYLLNYPYFPNSEPVDVLWHSEITRSVLRRDITSPVAAAGFPTGSHIMFAFVSAYLNLDVLSSLRVTSAILEALSVLVASCLFQRILPTKRAASYALVAFSLLIPAGFIYYARIGAYPNIVGDFFVLVSLLVLFVVSEKPTLPSVLTAVLVEGTALISHISVAILAALAIGFSVVVFRLFRSRFSGYVVSNLGFIAVPIAAFVLAPSLLARQTAYISTQYLDLNNNLGVVLLQWLHNYLLFVGPLNFLLLFSAFTWTLIRGEKRIWSSLLASWFGLLFLLVFVSTNDWRLILLSLIPGAGLLGLFLSKLHGILEGIAVRRISTIRLGRILVSLLMLAIIMLSTLGGSTVFAMNETMTGGQALRQSYIYESMMWLQANSPPDSYVVSVHLEKEYRYLPIVASRSFRGDYPLESADILKLEEIFRFEYVAVSTDFGGLQSFYQSEALRAEFANPVVVIFRVLTLP